MVKEIIINSSTTQTRVAITEDNKLVDFFVDYPESRRMVGDIYLGQVARVLPGIKAAFIDIGMQHDAFLHFSDIGEQTKDIQGLFDDDDEEDDDRQEAQPPEEVVRKTINGVPVLQKGERILIQITKEPVTNKGVRVTSAISIAGRFCVLLPYDNKIGVSKKITDFRERRRLRSIARTIIPKNCGLIIRTVARNQNEESLKEDLKYLWKSWVNIQEKAKELDPPSLIYQDVTTTASVIRDLFTSDVTKVYVDSKKVHKEIRDYLAVVQPELVDKIHQYRESESIFEAFGIETQIRELFSRKVPLKSGGYLIIEHTEAMVVIDVNSGKYAASKDQEMNSLRTDLEAAREISRQLRLRDIGGLIVIDFIDLEDDRNRKKVYDELRKEFKKDRAKVSVLPMSDFGLIEITRQRVRQNIMQTINEVCPYCLGSGVLTKKSHIIHEIEEWLTKFRSARDERSLLLKCNPNVCQSLKEGRISTLLKMQLKFKTRIKLTEDKLLQVDQFKFYLSKDKTEVTPLFASNTEE